MPFFKEKSVVLMGDTSPHLVVLIFIKTLKTELSVRTKLQNVKFIPANYRKKKILLDK